MLEYDLIIKMSVSVLKDKLAQLQSAVRNTEILMGSQIQQHHLTLHQTIQAITEAMLTHTMHEQQREQKLKKIITEKQDKIDTLIKHNHVLLQQLTRTQEELAQAQQEKHQLTRQQNSVIDSIEDFANALDNFSTPPNEKEDNEQRLLKRAEVVDFDEQSPENTLSTHQLPTISEVNEDEQSMDMETPSHTGGQQFEEALKVLKGFTLKQPDQAKQQIQLPTAKVPTDNLTDKPRTTLAKLQRMKQMIPNLEVESETILQAPPRATPTKQPTLSNFSTPSTPTQPVTNIHEAFNTAKSTLSQVLGCLKRVLTSEKVQDSHYTIRYIGGFMFQGQCNPKQQPHGYGRLTYKQRPVYQGEWVEGLPQGWGKLNCIAHLSNSTPVELNANFSQGHIEGTALFLVSRGTMLAEVSAGHLHSDITCLPSTAKPSPV